MEIFQNFLYKRSSPQNAVKFSNFYAKSRFLASRKFGFNKNIHEKNSTKSLRVITMNGNEVEKISSTPSTLRSPKILEKVYANPKPRKIKILFWILSFIIHSRVLISEEICQKAKIDKISFSLSYSFYKIFLSIISLEFQLKASVKYVSVRQFLVDILRFL